MHIPNPTSPSHINAQVKLSVGDSTGVQAELVFDGTASTTTSWFSKERLLSSPWTDLKGSATDYFAIDGDVVQV